MREEPYELLDQSCPGALALLRSVNTEVEAQGLRGEAAFVATLAKLNAGAVEHKRSCPRCCSFEPRAMKGFTRKQVVVLVLAIVAAIAFVETSEPVMTATFWRAFLLKLVLYGVVAEFVVIALGSWTNVFNDRRQW